MKNIIIKSLVVILLILVISDNSRSQTIVGTYVLESRVLADGTVIKPPQIMGVYNIEDGFVNFNLAYKDKTGKIQSVSFMGEYKFSPKEYHQEIFFLSIYDEISGGDKVHDFSPKQGTSPVSNNAGKIEFVYPPNDNVHATFEGNQLIAKRVDGSYRDYWKKIK